MTRLLPGIACLIVAAECALRAEGLMPQSIYLPGLEWLWWVTAALFGLAGACVWLRGCE